jgi:hypothetical protein
MTEPHPAPASAPEGPLTYYFTFGLDSLLTDRFIALRGTAEETRRIIVGIFDRQWAGQYNGTQWQEISHKHAHRGRPYQQLMLGINGERVITPDGVAVKSQSGKPRLTDEFGRDCGEILEVSAKDSGDPETSAFDVYTKTGS